MGKSSKKIERKQRKWKQRLGTASTSKRAHAQSTTSESEVESQVETVPELWANCNVTNDSDTAAKLHEENGALPSHDGLDAIEELNEPEVDMERAQDEIQRDDTESMTMGPRQENGDIAFVHRIFINYKNNFLAGMQSLKDKLNANENVRDDIKFQNNECKKLIAFGKEVNELVERLEVDLSGVELQLFSREADDIDATTKSHNAFFKEISDKKHSLGNLEEIVKRQRTIHDQDEILKNFSNRADKLMGSGHKDASTIDNRRRKVIFRRKAVNDLGNKLLRLLQDYQQFCDDADDLGTRFRFRF